LIVIVHSAPSLQPGDATSSAKLLPVMRVDAGFVGPPPPSFFAVATGSADVVALTTGVADDDEGDGAGDGVGAVVETVVALDGVGFVGEGSFEQAIADASSVARRSFFVIARKE
jgi:hypothetical protein